MRFLLVVMILAPPLWSQDDGWQVSHRFKLGLEYNSNLSEFTDPRMSAIYAKIQWDAGVRTGVHEFNGFLSGDLPLGESGGAPEREAAAFANGAVDYSRLFRLGAGAALRAKAFHQRRETEGDGDPPFVEEAPFTLFGAELAVAFLERADLVARFQELAVPEFPIYDHRLASLQARGTVWNRPAWRLWLSASYLRYAFEEKVLVVPASSDDPGPPHPVFMDHEDEALLGVLGVDLTGRALASFKVFYRDYDSTVPDYRHRDLGVEGMLSLRPAPRWTLTAQFRYEERDLAKPYLLFDPQILTGMGNRFAAVSVVRALSERLSVEAKAGRYANDLRQTFFGGTGPRYVVTMSLLIGF